MQECICINCRSSAYVPDIPRQTVAAYSRSVLYRASGARKVRPKPVNSWLPSSIQHPARIEIDKSKVRARRARPARCEGRRVDANNHRRFIRHHQRQNRKAGQKCKPGDEDEIPGRPPGHQRESRTAARKAMGRIAERSSRSEAKQNAKAGYHCLKLNSSQ